MADLDAFADAYGHAWCDGLAACCHFWPFHPDVCLEGARLRARQRVALATGPTSDLPHLNPAARDTCLAQIRQVVGACSDTGYPNVVAPQCEWVFSKGVTPLGGACKSDGNCAPPPDQPPLCLNETCGQAMTNLQEGAACGGPHQSCASSLACNRGTFTCGPKIAIGKSCGLSEDCVDGAYCGGVCTAYKAVGETCDAIVSCGSDAYCASTCHTFTATGSACTDSSTCMSGDYCSPMIKVCTPRVAIGQPCPYNPTGNDQPCADGGWCSRTSGTLLKPGDISRLVCVPKNLPVLCFTG